MKLLLAALVVGVVAIGGIQIGWMLSTGGSHQTVAQVSDKSPQAGPHIIQVDGGGM
jgi:hypothetical protein